MVKKLVVKKLKSVGKDSQLSATIRDSAEQIWLAGLGAFAKAQEEGTRVYDALIREGEAIQKKTRKVTEDKVTEMAAKATGTWDKLEQVFENRVARSLNSLGVPTKADVAATGQARGRTQGRGREAESWCRQGFEAGKRGQAGASRRCGQGRTQGRTQGGCLTPIFWHKP
jgi:poly(hydroxyalkanoate) granule-associated protein